jgi:hypothetical protein
MPQRETLLETASFLDSQQARALDSVPRADQAKIVERFLGCVYDDVGKAPRHLDAEDIHTILGHLLPGRFSKREPLARHAPMVLRAYLEFLEQTAILSQGYELRSALDEHMPHFRAAVESGKQHVHSHGEPVKPIVNRAEKVGRNDPCPCGSGKKFKQCCAKLG